MTYEKADKTKIVEYKCCFCGQIAGKIKAGSLLARSVGMELICRSCREKWAIFKKSIMTGKV